MSAPAPPAPALAIVELASLSRAAVVLDAMVKRAPVRLRLAERVSPGKFLIVLEGGVAEIEESFGAGLAVADGLVVAKLFLPQVHRAIADALRGSYGAGAVDSLASFEAYNASDAILALDTALKATEVQLLGLHLGQGAGGKGYWAVSGDLHAVQEAIEAALLSVPRDVVVSSDVIGAPHPDAVGAFLAPWRPLPAPS
jgi:microcompartment protein CcmL/EutN